MSTKTRSMNALVIEPDRRIGDLIKSIFYLDLKYQTAVFHDYIDAFNHLKAMKDRENFPYDFMFTDTNNVVPPTSIDRELDTLLPQRRQRRKSNLVLDGIDFTKIVSDLYPKLPIVLSLSHATDRTFEKQSRNVHRIIHPFSPSELVAKIKGVLQETS